MYASIFFHLFETMHGMCYDIENRNPLFFGAFPQRKNDGVSAILKNKELIGMDWVKQLNQALAYIEANLEGEIHLERAAQLACCSTYHFQRMFTYLAGIPLSEYIRRRRMTKAALDLQNGAKVLDVALKYGYDSPTAFNRAFRGIHGVAPSSAKEPGVQLCSFQPISFVITIKGEVALNYRIEHKEAFRIVGIHAPMEKEIERNFQTVPKLWEEIASGGILPKLLPLMNGQLSGVLGVCACGEKEDWRYWIAVASDAPSGEFDAYTIPAFTWAIFPGSGPMPGAIQELEKRIATEWLPTSGYEFADGPDVEVYFTPDPKQATFEVWVPVCKGTETK